MEIGEQMGAPADRGGLAGASRVLDQITQARAFLQHRFDQQPGDGQLVVAGEDEAADLLGLVALGDAVTTQDLQPALAFPHLLPEVGRGVAGAERIAGAAVGPTGIGAAVEGQELGAAALQPGGHLHLAVAHGEVHQGAAGE